MQVRGWIRDGRVLVNGAPGKAGRFVRSGQVITVDLPPLQAHAAAAENLDLPLRYRDDHLVVVAKPAGMATHPSPGWWRGSCVNALLGAIAEWPGVGGVAGPGVVHRLDRDTTGLLVFALSDPAHRQLNDDFRTRQIARRYLAWVEGELSGESLLTGPLRWDPEFASPDRRVHVHPEGRPARTRYRCLGSRNGRTLVELSLETGRTHQIRVHMANLGHPVIGDALYGQQGPALALHAYHLELVHPITGEPMVWMEPPPVSWETWESITEWLDLHKPLAGFHNGR